MRTEDAVDTAGIETEILQLALQDRDIVATHEMSGCVRERTITELPARFFEMTQCLWPDKTVNNKTTFLLECANRGINGIVECVRTLGVSQQPEAIKSCPEICDLRTAVTKAQGR